MVATRPAGPAAATVDRDPEVRLGGVGSPVGAPGVGTDRRRADRPRLGATDDEFAELCGDVGVMLRVLHHDGDPGPVSEVLLDPSLCPQAFVGVVGVAAAGEVVEPRQHLGQR